MILIHASDSSAKPSWDTMIDDGSQIGSVINKNEGLITFNTEDSGKVAHLYLGQTYGDYCEKSTLELLHLRTN